MMPTNCPSGTPPVSVHTDTDPGTGRPILVVRYAGDVSVKMTPALVALLYRLAGELDEGEPAQYAQALAAAYHESDALAELVQEAMAYADDTRADPGVSEPLAEILLRGRRLAVRLAVLVGGVGAQPADRGLDVQPNPDGN